MTPLHYSFLLDTYQLPSSTMPNIFQSVKDIIYSNHTFCIIDQSTTVQTVIVCTNPTEIIQMILRFIPLILVIRSFLYAFYK